jgi:ABC-type lipoprotein export system ATPase subunit
LLRGHADRGAAILLVTHSPEVVGHADRVVELRDGRVIS